MSAKVRSEHEIFEDFETLAASPQFAHAIAFFSFRDNYTGFGEYLRPDDLLHSNQYEKLIRNEISTLIGVAAKQGKPDIAPEPEQIQTLIDKTESLIKELHTSIAQPMHEIFKTLPKHQPDTDPFDSADVIREPILYGPESAYTFQYLELFPLKYAQDKQWFQDKFSLSLSEIRHLAESVATVLSKKLESFRTSALAQSPSDWNLLNIFTLDAETLSETSSLDLSLVRYFMNHFSTSFADNNTFQNVSDFNRTNAYPFLKWDDSHFILFQIYTLYEALYETPYFEMISDARYKDAAAEHRGDFLEDYSYDKLCNIFGEEHVFKNVIFQDSKRRHLDEADVRNCSAPGARLLRSSR